MGLLPLKKWFLFLFIGIASQLFAETSLLPEKLQVAFFTKIFSYSTSLQSIASPKLLIIHCESSRREAQTLAESFSDVEYTIQIISQQECADSLETEIQAANVVYFFPGSEQAAFLCREHKRLSISASPEMAEQGAVSIALGLENHRPRIFMNVSTLKEEEQAFSANLLQIAKIYE